MASHVYQYNCKFLFDRYGEVKHYYPGTVEMKVIETDLKELLKEKYSDDKYQQLIDPQDLFA